MKEQREAMIEAFRSVKNEEMRFDGNFSGTISYVRPKKMPAFQRIEKPVSMSEQALRWAGVLAPSIVGVAGIYYNHKTSTDLSGDAKDISIANTNADVQMFESMAGTKNASIYTDYSVKTDSYNSGSGNLRTDDFDNSRKEETVNEVVTE